MQSKTSFFNRAIFDKNLRRGISFSLVIFIVLLIIVPIAYALGITANDSWSRELPKYYHMYSNLQNRTLQVFWAVTGMLSMLSAMGFLFLKRDTYMMHSFPVSRKALYFTGVLTSLVEQLVPLFLVTLISVILAATTGTSETIPAIGYWAYCNTAAIVFFTGFSAVCIMITGQAITSVIFYAILNNVFIGMRFVIVMLQAKFCFGLSDGLNQLDYGPTTPFIYISRCGIKAEPVWSVTGRHLSSMKVTYEYPGILAAYAIVGIAFLFAAYLLYSKKKIESVHEFISVGFVKPIFTVGMTFFVSAALAVATEEMVSSNFRFKEPQSFVFIVVTTLIYSFIVFCITQMLVERNTRIFNKNRIKYYCGIAVGIVVVLVGIRVDVFGVERRVPNAEDIEWAGINGRYTYVFTEPSDIEEIRRIHKDIIANKEDFLSVDVPEDVEDAWGTMIIKYKLKDGKTVYRSYAIAKEEYGNDNYRNILSGVDEYLNNPTRIKEHIIGKFYDNCEVTNIEFSKVVKEGDIYTTDYGNHNFGSANEKQEAYDKVYQALLKDIDEGAVLQNSYTYSNVNGDYYNDLSIELKQKEKTVANDDELFYGWLNENSYEKDSTHNYYIVLNSKCKNTIATLIELGYADSEADFITYKEVEDNNDNVVCEE